jgi:hypothetical protein
MFQTDFIPSNRWKTSAGIEIIDEIQILKYYCFYFARSIFHIMSSVIERQSGFQEDCRNRRLRRSESTTSIRFLRYFRYFGYYREISKNLMKLEMAIIYHDELKKFLSLDAS